MNEKNTVNPLGLIDLNNLKINERIVDKLSYKEFPEKKYNILTKDDYLIIHVDFPSLFEKKRKQNQYEFPIKSIRWICETLENKFLKSPEEGGLPQSARRLDTYTENENIGINASANCCAEFQPGYDIWNASRNSYLSGAQGQTWQVPTYQFTQNGLLDKLKKIADDYEKGLL